MAKLFQITRPDGMSTVKLDSQGQATVQYTVKNVSARVIDGRAVLVSLSPRPPDGPVEKGWVKVDGRAEKRFDVNEEQIFTVKIAVPPNTPAGSYTFRQDVVWVDKPDEGDQGQTVGFTVTMTPSPPPIRWWIPVAAGVVVLAVLGIGGWLLLRDSKIEVPNVVGKQIKDAIELLEKANLTIKENPQPSPSGPFQQVTLQDPVAGAKIDPEKQPVILTFTVPTPAPTEVTVPNVVTLPFDKALEILLKAGLKAARKRTQQPSVTSAAGTVMTQEPAAFSPVQPGETINLVIARPGVTVPSVTELKLGDAIRLLSQDNLTALIAVDEAGRIVPKSPQNTDSNALVERQCPEKARVAIKSFPVVLLTRGHPLLAVSCLALFHQLFGQTLFQKKPDGTIDRDGLQDLQALLGPG